MNATAELLGAIREGEESIIGRLYDQHRTRFMIWAKRKFPLESTALIDIYQDAVIILYQNVVEEKVTELSSSLETYLFGIAKHLCLRELRRRRRAISQENEIPEVAVAPEFLRQEEQDHRQTLLKEGLRLLGENCRQMIEYFYYYNFSHEVIAERMSYKSANAVKTQKHRCMQQLKDLLKNASS
ncbi:MAG: sigma-70 family RNA polymerase sigma factor [Bacteroidota bacterium]